MTNRPFARRIRQGIFCVCFGLAISAGRAFAGDHADASSVSRARHSGSEVRVVPIAGQAIPLNVDSTGLDLPSVVHESEVVTGGLSLKQDPPPLLVESLEPVGAAGKADPERSALGSLVGLSAVSTSLGEGGRGNIGKVQAASGVVFEGGAKNGSVSDGGPNGSREDGKLPAAAPLFNVSDDGIGLFPQEKVSWNFLVGGANTPLTLDPKYNGFIVLSPKGVDYAKEPVVGSLVRVTKWEPPKEGWKEGASFPMDLEGEALVRVLQQETEGGIVLARIAPIQLVSTDAENEDILAQVVRRLLNDLVGVSGMDSDIQRRIKDAHQKATDSVDPKALVVNISRYIPIEDQRERRKFLAESSIYNRLERIVGFLRKTAAKAGVAERAKESEADELRRYHLRHQMNAIRKELGEDQDEIAALKAAAEQAQLPAAAAKEVADQIQTLTHTPKTNSEYAPLIRRARWLISLPWSRRSEESRDLRRARQILDEDHFGLDKAKERIIEHLAVYLHTGKSNGKILLLVGPPGTGKTSIAKSVARALNRGFQKISLGGSRDEADIRGHRSTYVGAQPGKVMKAVERGGYKNLVLLFDEIDKMAESYQGDPRAALLEVFDPEQNKSFMDNYAGIGFDLSEAFMIATANSLEAFSGTSAKPLLDRMEIVHIEGYDPEQKLQIARDYVVPQELADHGVTTVFPDDTIRHIIAKYTTESGVRNLQRRFQQILRRMVKALQEHGVQPPTSVTPDDIDAKYLDDPIKRRKIAENGVGEVTGLWVNGDGDSGTLPVQVAMLPGGRGNVTLNLTGRLGDVMKESALKALSLVRSKNAELGIPLEKFTQYDLHIDVPDGVTPKDGPSAGAAFVTAIVSAMTGIPVKKEVAMTGEITLKGKVIAIGGLKMKALAAERDGLTLMIFPADNTDDLKDISSKTKARLNMSPVNDIMQVLRQALESELTPLPK